MLILERIWILYAYLVTHCTCGRRIWFNITVNIETAINQHQKLSDPCPSSVLVQVSSTIWGSVTGGWTGWSLVHHLQPDIILQRNSVCYIRPLSDLIRKQDLSRFVNWVENKMLSLIQSVGFEKFCSTNSDIYFAVVIFQSELHHHVLILLLLMWHWLGLSIEN